MSIESGHYLASCGICGRTEHEIPVYEWTEHGLSICARCQEHLVRAAHCVGSWRVLGLAIERDHMNLVNRYRVNRRHHASD